MKEIEKYLVKKNNLYIQQMFLKHNPANLIDLK